MFVPKENLPSVSCPPPEAKPISGVYARLIDAEKYKDNFCASFNALGRVMRKNADPCLWAACSLLEYDEAWPEGPVARLIDFARSANLLQYKSHAAILKISTADGVAKKGYDASVHVSFWMDKSFDPKAAVMKVVPLL